MPDSTVIPVLTYPNLHEAVTWLTGILGFKERWRIGDHRAQLTCGNCTIAITASASQQPTALILRITDIDSHFTKSQSSQVRIISPPADHFYGERQYTIEDVGGHYWTLSETVKEMAPEDWGAITSSDNSCQS